MDAGETVFLAFTLAGGLALFLFGMQLMTEGLRAAAGDRLRLVIYRSTGNRLAGLGLGTGLGFLMHSSATTVMTVGFINAGLLGLAQSVPVLMGANLGTTLSMQLISLKLTDYALFAVALGFLVSAVTPSPMLHSVGRSLLGFGLLFMGMDLMSGAIEPHREALMPWLAAIDGTTWRGMLLGTLIAWLFTAVVQSSGATIGMTFVLLSAGAFNSLEQVYPIVLGAHLGTTTTAIIASLGAGIEAKRGAAANLAFNVANVALAVLAAPLFITAIEATSADIVRQTANLHTAIMLVAAIALLPFSGWIAAALRRLLPSRQPVPAVSFLVPDLLAMPENALTAVIREARRSLAISMQSLRAARKFAAATDERRRPRAMAVNEQAVNEIRDATLAYLERLTKRYLSRRQSLLAQYLSHIASDIERVGDHLEHIVESLEAQRRTPNAAYDDRMREGLLTLFDEAMDVLEAAHQSLDAEQARFPDAADALEAARDTFVEHSQHIRQAVNDRVAAHEVHAIAGIYFSRQVISFDYMVRHCRMIAREEQQPFFALEPAKLDRMEPAAEEKRPPSDQGLPRAARQR